MEGLGPKLQQARLSRGLTLDEAGRLTKIRPSKLAEIEAEDFSNFASLAYAKGFLQIYGKFLDVDVSQYLEAFETPDQVTTDGYSYLQDNPAPKPTRPSVVVRKAPSERGSLLPLIIGIVVLVVGFYVLKLFLDVQRVKTPARAGDASPTATPAQIVAPRALPVENTAPATAASNNRANAATTNTNAAPVTQTTPNATTTPAVAAANPPAVQPEVRRAEPVHAEDLAGTTAASSPTTVANSATTTTTLNKIEIRPLKKTYLKVVVDGKSDSPAVQRWISASDGTVKIAGQRVAIRVLDPTAVEIRKNGKRVSSSDADVTIE